MNWSRFGHEPNALKLYGYWRSSASWRVRWALAIKGIPYEYIPVDLLKGENNSSTHLKRNPAGAVPVLEIIAKSGESDFLSESVAIMEWIDEVYSLKGPSLFPGLPLERAHIRHMVEIVNSMTAPLQIPKVQKKYSDEPEKRNQWAQFWIIEGLNVFAKLQKTYGGRWSFGDELSAADIALIPQIYNAIRYEIDVKAMWPRLWEIYQNARALESCVVADPDHQKDTPRTV